MSEMAFGNIKIVGANLGAIPLTAIYLGNIRIYPTEMGSASWTVSSVDGALYGFTMNDDGYYESTNKKIPNSAALCKVTIENPENLDVYIDCINYAEYNYDYGILSQVDKTLSTSYTADSIYYKSFKYDNSGRVEPIYYGQVSGTIYIKFIKDSGTNSNNDSLQFRVRFEQPEATDPPEEVVEGVTIENVAGATYGFVLNANGYYESTNKGVDSSFAMCKLNINNPDNKYVHIVCINYAEANYDYGIISQLDTPLSLDNKADGTYFYTFRYSNSSAEKILTYGQVHGAIYVKFLKDSGYNQYNDSLQFKVILSDEPTLTTSSISDYI